MGANLCVGSVLSLASVVPSYRNWNARHSLRSAPTTRTNNNLPFAFTRKLRQLHVIDFIITWRSSMTGFDVLILLFIVIALYCVVTWTNKPKDYNSEETGHRTTPTPISRDVAPRQRQSYASAPPKPISATTAGKKIPSRVDHAPPPPIPSSMELLGKAYVIDGDTIVVSKIKVRLAGIDAPELDQPWGQKSKWEMVRLCKGQAIRVELTGETSYDRLVGTCYLPDGTDIGAEIIRSGLALDGGRYSKGKYRHLEPDGIRRKLKFYGHWR